MPTEGSRLTGFLPVVGVANICHDRPEVVGIPNGLDAHRLNRDRCNRQEPDTAFDADLSLLVAMRFALKTVRR